MLKIFSSHFTTTNGKTLNDLANLSELFCRSLNAKNVKKVAISLDDSFDFLVAFFGANLAKKEIILPQNKNFEMLMEMPEALEVSKNENFINITNSNFAEFLTKNDKKTNEKKEKTATKLSLSLPFFFQTSGSSGEPKLVAKTLRQMLNEANFLARHFAFSTHETLLASTPLTHLFGLTFKGFTALVSGAKVEPKQCIYPEVILEKSQKFAECDVVLVATPTVLNALCEHANLANACNIRRVFSAGSKLAPQIRQKLKTALPNLQIVEIFGSSETGVVAFDNGNGLFKFDEVDVWSENERLCVRSLWQDAGDGVPFLTSDCGVVGDDGAVEIFGRCDRLVKLHEKRVSLDKIEKVLTNSGFVAESFVGVKESLESFKVLKNEKNANFESGENANLQNGESVANGENVNLQSSEKSEKSENTNLTNTMLENVRLFALVVLNEKGKREFLNGGKKALVEKLKNVLKNEFGSLVRFFKIVEKLPYNERGKVAKKDALAKLYERAEPKFEILEKSENSIVLHSFVSPEWFYFEGHFSSFPLTPGFVQLGWALRAVGEFFGVQICRVNSVKFVAFLRPFDEVFVEIVKKEKRFEFEVKNQNGRCCYGRI